MPHKISNLIPGEHFNNLFTLPVPIIIKLKPLYFPQIYVQVFSPFCNKILTHSLEFSSWFKLCGYIFIHYKHPGNSMLYSRVRRRKKFQVLGSNV